MSFTDTISKYSMIAVFASASLASSFPKAECQQPPDYASDCCSLVTQALSAIDQLKNGSTRAEVERLFVADGGLFSRERTIYVYKRCSSIKIVVSFSTDKDVSSFASGVATDHVVSISKPYIEHPIAD